MTVSVASVVRPQLIRRDNTQAAGFRTLAWGRQEKNEFIS